MVISHAQKIWEVNAANHGSSLGGGGGGGDDDGPVVLFLEEDHMLAPDFFETLLNLDRLCTSTPNCRALQLHNSGKCVYL